MSDKRSLYSDLMALTDNEAFYFKDIVKDDRTYRIFNYRLASYTAFLAPNALECRGIMYDITNKPILVSRPMEKFFNLYENPLTMELDLSTIVNIELKADGSLISTYIHNGTLMLKSKASLESDQALVAMKWLALPENKALFNEIHSVVLLGNTVNLEWCAPDNRIVVDYLEPVLTVLNIRHNQSGEYMAFNNIAGTYPEIEKRHVEIINVDDPVDFVNSIASVKGVEGYVVRLSSGQRVKIKTEWYSAQHRAKSSIDSPLHLFEAVLEETSDDLRSLFHDRPLIIKQIDEMEQKVDGLYNHLVAQVERFYERNKHMDRKDYAVLGKKELDRKLMKLVMLKYLCKEVDYKAFCKKHYRDEILQGS